MRKIFRWGIKEEIGSSGIKTGAAEEDKQVVQAGIEDHGEKNVLRWGQNKTGAEDGGG